MYRFLYRRVDYPLERGYRMEATPLPDWIHLTVEIQRDSKQLVVHSRIHKNKRVAVGSSYSRDWKDLDIIKDLSGEISYRFL